MLPVSAAAEQDEQANFFNKKAQTSTATRLQIS
jgi:hypothetical protein